MTHNDAPFSVFLPYGILHSPLAIFVPPCQRGILKDGNKDVQ